MKEVIYEKHPVSPERKKELVDKGYKIIDARFKPEVKAEKPVKEVKPEVKAEKSKANK